MRLQSALSLREFAGLDDFGRTRPRRRQKRRAPERAGLPRKPRREPEQAPALVAARRTAPDEVLEAEIIEAEPVPTRRAWSPSVTMGPNLRIQAAQGFRAAVIELKPGLFVVAEVPEHVTRSEFGIVPLLAPLVVRAATKAITTPPEQRTLPKLVQAMQQQPPQAAAPPALPGPVATPAQPEPRALIPAAGAGAGHAQLLPAPVLGRWVDQDDLAGLFGCDACDGKCGR